MSVKKSGAVGIDVLGVGDGDGLDALDTAATGFCIQACIDADAHAHVNQSLHSLFLAARDVMTPTGT